MHDSLQKILNLEKFIPQKIIKTFEVCSQAAEELSVKIFLIGGAVRDIIIEKNNFDTDITVQGNAVSFANYLEQNYPEICKIKEIHESFGTAKVIFNINNEQIDIDIASTRKETYPVSGCLPVVEEIGCELYEDVKRRDFSINSIALSLNKNTFGELADYLGGYEDIKGKKMCVLHEKSFIDDPTRIVRALKFRVRFGYELGENTKKFQEKCLESKLFDNFCGERIKSELKQTFNLNKSEILDIFMNENIFRLLDTEIKIPNSLSKTCESTINEYSDFINPDFIWLIYLGALLSDFSSEKISSIAQNLYLSGKEANILTESKILLEKESIKDTNFEIYEFFEGFSTEAIMVYLIKTPESREKADLYIKELRNRKIHTTGQTLIDMGLVPSPVFGEILRQLLKARINKEFYSEEDEKNFLSKIISYTDSNK